MNKRDISWAWDFVQPGEGESSTVLVEQRAAEGDPEAEPGTTLFVASTEDEDRAMDVVRQDWVNRSNFDRNPVILDNHNPYRVVGRGQSAKVPRKGDDAGKLMVRVKWDLESPDPTIAAVGHQHLNGFRAAGSVGFKSGRKTLRSKLDPNSPYYQQPIEVETWWGGTVEMSGTLYERNELLEFSSATIPMNPNALQRSLLSAYADVDPADASARAALTLPAEAAAGVLGMIETHRAQVLELLWPDVLERARTDTTFRRILRAAIDAGPPAETPFASLVARALECAG